MNSKSFAWVVWGAILVPVQEHVHQCVQVTVNAHVCRRVFDRVVVHIIQRHTLQPRTRVEGNQ